MRLYLQEETPRCFGMIWDDGLISCQVFVEHQFHGLDLSSILRAVSKLSCVLALSCDLRSDAVSR